MRNSTKRKKAARLVTNAGAAADAPALTTGVYSNLTFNLQSNLVRNGTMEGRNYKVVPMVMITEGVHNGSQGALYYPKEELQSAVSVWNHKPIVVNHPEVNGKGVSACDPKIIDSHKIGVIMNTKLDALGRLKAEAWIEEERANKIEPRIMQNVTAGNKMEVSTGLFTDNEQTGGTWKGEAYDAIARNHKPDHLAILPDSTGACSIKDGAGLLRNEASARADGMPPHFIEAAVVHTLRSLGAKDITANDLSFDNIRSQLYTLIRQKLKPNSKDFVDVWIEDVFEGYFIYSFAGKLSKLGYVVSGEVKVELEGEPEEVVRVTEYKTSTGAVIGNHQSNNKPTKVIMNKKDIIDQLVANAASGWKETDRDFLMGCSDERLQVIANNAKPAAPAKDEGKDNKDGKKPVENAAPATQAPTLNAEDQAALDYGKRQLAQNKAKLIADIKANPANKFTDATLNAKPIDELEQIAELARNSAPQAPAQPQHFYGGQAPAAVVQNAGKDEDQKPLGTPVMNFGKDDKS